MTAAIRMSSSGTCGCLPHLEFREIGLSFSFTLQKRGEGGTKKEQNCNNNNFDIVWFETSGRGMKSWPSSQGKKNEWILLFTFINGWWFELPLRLSMSEFMMTCSTDFSGTSSPPPYYDSEWPAEKVLLVFAVVFIEYRKRENEEKHVGD